LLRNWASRGDSWVRPGDAGRWGWPWSITVIGLAWGPIKGPQDFLVRAVAIPVRQGRKGLIGVETTCLGRIKGLVPELQTNHQATQTSP